MRFREVSSRLLENALAVCFLWPTGSTPPRWTHLESAPRTKLLRKHRQTSCPKTRYIYPLIYHKNEPFLWVNLPVPWILWKKMNELFHQRNQSRDKTWEPCRMAYKKQKIHSKEELIIPFSIIIQQLTNYLCLPFPILLIFCMVFGQQWQHDWPWDALLKSWNEVSSSRYCPNWNYLYSSLHFFLHHAYVWICVVKMHLVLNSCLDKGKFTLPKKVMFNQNKGHLRGFPHSNPSKSLPFQSFFSRFK